MTNMDAYVNDFNKKKENIKNKLRIITTIRIIIFFVLVFSIITFFLSSNKTIKISFLIMSIIIILAFIIISITTKKIYTQDLINKNKETIIKKHNIRRSDTFNHKEGFLDKGDDLKNIFIKTNNLKDKYLVEDIDIFGSNSIYQLSTSCHTVIGRYKYAKRLVDGKNYDLDNSKKVYELGNDTKSIDIESLLMLNKSQTDIDPDTYSEMVTKKYQDRKKSIMELVLLYMISIGIIIYSIFKKQYYYILIPFILQFFNSFRYKEEIDNQNINIINQSLENYSTVIKELSKLNLTSLNDKYTKEYFLNSYKKIKKLSGLWQVKNYKRNFIFKLLANGIFSFELIFQLIYNSKIINKDELEEILNDIADIEINSSLATLVFDYTSCIPNDSSELSFTNLINPLIYNCQANDFTYEKGVILTGSNMSGKTTFLRTLATSLIILNAGGCPQASSFCAKKLYVYTSLRIKDELESGISSFYAEINKIKEMVSSHNVPNGYNKICLIDEIFRGTNTKDRVFGAKELVKKLEKENYLFLISTHDFELCEIPTIINYHFSEYYTNEYKNIVFDYKLLPGRSKSTNAIYLLKASSIIE